MAVDTGGVATAPAPARPLWNGRRPEIVAAVRACVRGLLEQSEAFATADPDTRRAVAHKMVKVALAGADLAAQDVELSQAIAESSAVRAPRPAPLATAQTASDQMGMAAARAAGGTIQSLKTAIDFPGFVTSLINGVFGAITSSAITQLTQLSDLLDNVSASTESFTEQNIRDEDIVSWTVAKFPFFVRQDESSLAVREGTDLTTQARTLKEGLGASESEVSSIDESDLVGSLGPLVKRKMGRDRQQILGTLVQMGLQRIVVDEGRLHASMDMRVDTRSVSEEDKRSRSEVGVETKASANVGVGAWGASASVAANYSQVQSDAQFTKEEIDTRAGLRSSVDLAFRTEQIPLDRMADGKARVKLDLNARVPASVSEGSLLTTDVHAGEVAAPPRPAAPPAQQPAQQPGQQPAQRPAQGTQQPQQGGTQQPRTQTQQPQQGGTQQPRTQTQQPQRGGTQQPRTQTQQPRTQTQQPQQGGTQQGGTQQPRTQTTQTSQTTQPQRGGTQQQSPQGQQGGTQSQQPTQGTQQQTQQPQQGSTA